MCQIKIVQDEFRTRLQFLDRSVQWTIPIYRQGNSCDCVPPIITVEAA